MEKQMLSIFGNPRRTSTGLSVTVRGQTMQEVQTKTAADLAQNEARRYMNQPTLSEDGTPYPVNEAGNLRPDGSPDHQADADVHSGRVPTAAYHADFVFMEKA
jgi:hypothetical protein